MQKEKRAESEDFLHKKISVALAKKCMLDTLCIVIMGGCKCKSTTFWESTKSLGKVRRAQGFSRKRRDLWLILKVFGKAQEVQGFWKKNARSLRISFTKHVRHEDFGQSPKSAVFSDNAKYFWQSVVFYIMLFFMKCNLLQVSTAWPSFINKYLPDIDG
jgi:hypothetical protein